LNGKQITNASALQVGVSEVMPGTHIELGILRNGTQKNMNVTVGSFYPLTPVAFCSSSIHPAFFKVCHRQ